MKYKNVSLPYPVLGIHDDVYPLLEDGCVKMETPVKTASEYRFGITLTQRNKDITALVAQGKAEYACEVTCKDTFLRRCWHSSIPKFDITIGRKEVSGHIDFQCFIAAKEDIPGYTNSDFNEDYYGFSFDLEVGDMLAVFPLAWWNTEIKYDKLYAAGSFMQIVEAADGIDKTWFNLEEQRPDIVVTITKPDGFVLTYLYDAKYRVQDDKNDGELDEGTNIDLADYPLPDAINQMHRYRDAIYYAMKEDERPRGKEVIGGYILFPGRTEGAAVENRYFFKSIKQVNIGAFPLLPADEEHKEKVVLCDLLEMHLKEILLDDTAYEQIKDSIPQKGLRYQEGGNGNGVALVMMENYEGKQKGFSSGKVAIPIKLTESGMTLLENQANIAYVLFHTRKKDENKHLFKTQSIVRILPKVEAISEGYYLVQSTAKRYICVEIDLMKELESPNLNPSIDNVPYDAKTERYDSQYSTLEILGKNHEGQDNTFEKETISRQLGG